jgi:hypothetical protein
LSFKLEYRSLFVVVIVSGSVAESVFGERERERERERDNQSIHRGGEISQILFLLRA